MHLATFTLMTILKQIAFQTYILKRKKAVIILVSTVFPSPCPVTGSVEMVPSS